MLRKVIHIPGSKRRTHIVNEMNSHYLNEYEFFDAIVNNQTPTKGLSDSIKKIITDNYNEPLIHILEDDVKFTSKNSRKYFEEIFEKLPEDWDIYLGGSYGFDVLSSHEGFVKCNSFSSLHSVVINKKCYDIIMAHDSNDWAFRHLDFYLSNQIKNGLNVYLAYPMVAVQIPGFSYLKKSLVNHDDLLKNYLLYS